MKEIFERVLAYYVEHTEVVKGLYDLRKIQEHLSEANMDFGICKCLKERFNIDYLQVEREYFKVLKPYTIQKEGHRDEQFIAQIPTLANSKTEVIELL